MGQGYNTCKGSNTSPTGVLKNSTRGSPPDVGRSIKIMSSRYGIAVVYTETNNIVISNHCTYNSDRNTTQLIYNAKQSINNILNSTYYCRQRWHERTEKRKGREDTSTTPNAGYLDSDNRKRKRVRVLLQNLKVTTGTTTNFQITSNTTVLRETAGVTGKVKYENKTK